MHEDIERVLISKEEIDARLAEVGAQITADYKDKVDDGIIVMCVLKGAVIFMTDLVRHIDLPLQMDFMVVSSYYNSAQSSGRARIEQDMSCEVYGKHVIIAEDVVETGITLNYVVEHIKEREPKSVSICAMTHKHVEQKPLDVRYTCFDCPKDFIVGYGLDYAQKYRNLPYIGALKREIYETDGE